MTGILLIDKPEGLTSADVVRQVKGKSRTKVGHLGTLDPFATGVLPLCLGSATRIAQFLNVADKRYEGRIRLGTATDTGDRTGRVTRESAVPVIDEARIREAETRFTGAIEQIPPMYSAIKREGVPLYKLARKGIEVERPAREIVIRSLRLSRSADDELTFDVHCSKGTYVRVLAEDIGRFLGTEAHLTSLRRTRFGPFDVRDAAPLEGEPWGRALVTVEQALAHLPSVAVGAAEVEHLRHGRNRFIERLGLPVQADTVALIGPDHTVAAVLVHEPGGWTIGRVLAGTPEVES